MIGKGLSWAGGQWTTSLRLSIGFFQVADIVPFSLRIFGITV